MRLINSKKSKIRFDSNNFNQIIISDIEETENNLNLKIERVKNLISAIESHEINTGKISDKNDNKITEIIEANLESQKIENKKSTIRRKPIKKPSKIIIRKSKQ